MAETESVEATPQDVGVAAVGSGTSSKNTPLSTRAPSPLRELREGRGSGLLGDLVRSHQSQLAPSENKFHVGNGDDGKHYWLTPPDLYQRLDAEFAFDFDPCPFPLPAGFDGLTCEWGRSSYVNPPFGSIIHQGKKKGPTAWIRKAIEEHRKGKAVVLVYPVDKWVLMILSEILGEHAEVRNLGDVRWLATEDRSQGKGTGRHIACFILRGARS